MVVGGTATAGGGNTHTEEVDRAVDNVGTGDLRPPCNPRGRPTPPPPPPAVVLGRLPATVLVLITEVPPGKLFSPEAPEITAGGVRMLNTRLTCEGSAGEDPSRRKVAAAMAPAVIGRLPEVPGRLETAPNPPPLPPTDRGW